MARVRGDALPDEVPHEELFKLRELVPQVPAPVIAAVLGFHHATTQRQRAAGGGTWSQYATR